MDHAHRMVAQVGRDEPHARGAPLLRVSIGAAVRDLEVNGHAGKGGVGSRVGAGDGARGEWVVSALVAKHHRARSHLGAATTHTRGGARRK
jgi:hypothetical protein